MKIIKLGLISVVVLFIIATLIGLLLPSTVTVSKAIDIQQSPDSVMGYLSDLKRWPEWIEGVKSNGFAVTTTATTGVGAKATVNKNIITITSVQKDKVLTLWEGSNGFNQDAVMEVYTNETRSMTTMHWSFTQKIGWYPWQRLGSFMNEKILGPVMEMSLSNLKKVVEQQ
ncbi:Polyketide cyclase / dehydrase and lipid transport [Filimonas lacunae]|uniref:Polyketide cyclase / dehydrase and lipid transport n=1 Tax=Filimonas lacunae TaxID=477680 RepID=A0A173MDZ2_9BACT|nr:SRPBCC family protein [Filimonas lacunae]BAV05813.1 hypothetical protein FLA_1825 [Filimonas lacunae]SIT28524.1 Polyketide cyclase / dehydrase and lipid transport [Filimonas lacunae]